MSRLTGPKKHHLYTVYDNRTDMPVIVDGRAKDAAKAMGLSMKSFYNTVTRVRIGKNKRWYVDVRTERRK